MNEKCDICGKEFKKRQGLSMHYAYHNPEFKERHSFATKAAMSSPIIREKVSIRTRAGKAKPEAKAKRKAIDALPETKINRSLATKKTWEDFEVREKRIIGQKQAFAKPEIIEKRSKAQKEAWSDIDLREKHSQIIHDTWQKPGMKEKYEKALNTPEVILKRHETMKRNGTYGKKTKPEILLESFLQSTFGSDNVVYQKFVYRWPIDFYIKSIDVYIQLDGVYWHGLDRNIEKIASSKSKRDANICKCYYKDSEQNAWFKTNNLMLVRITDKEVKRGDFSKLKELLP